MPPLWLWHASQHFCLLTDAAQVVSGIALAPVLDGMNPLVL